MRVSKARLGVAALAASWAIGLSGFTAQAEEPWVITSFHSDVSIASSSALTITEDVTVDFGSLQKHGIFRTIPLRYRFDDSHDRYYQMQVASVTDGARPVTHSDSIDSDNYVIKIGSPNVLVSGAKRYVITYTVVGAMNSFTDRDELFWNVDGGLWPVSKQKVTATVHVPSNAFQKAACYQGPTGSRETCTFGPAGSAINYSSTRQLASGEQMSIVTALNKGAVNVPPPLLESRLRRFPQDAFDINPLTVGLALLLLAAGIGFVVWNWWVHGRDRAYLTQYYLTNDPRQGAEPLFRHDPVVVEFAPPQDLRPAELGLILDEKADPKDVTATIVDLAVRGFLTIAEVPGKKDWVLTKMRSWDPAELVPFENTILAGLFAGRQQVTLSDLKGTFQLELRTAEGQMYKDAMSRKWFSSSPQQSRAAWGCLGFGVLLVGVAVAYVLGTQFGWGLIGGAVVLTGLALTISFPFMTQRTGAGRDLLQHTLGFRMYMTTAEKYRQQFAAKAEIFTQLLPYAIVFGCVTMWAKAFEGIDTSGTNTWYVGSGPFQAALLSSSLQSMNANISSAIAFSPSSGSSSGFGGGGFSGGGGGGGGGGAW
ncbi:MAG TPA: DUF2207 domain-containing protein [Candidatus Nitrosopolaris sp.]|nr:DUF2207 domain-containing protein [Candidatus Nitrosopolaris sp.]